MRYGFGIDVGGMSVKIGVFDETGRLIEESAIPTDVSDGGAGILPDIAEALEDIRCRPWLKEAELLGIGIGVPGPVDDRGIVNRCVNLNWGVFNLEQELSKLTDLRVKAGNDANVAALGEYWKGSGADYDSACLITLGTGVGGGVVIKDQVIHGAHGAGGEIGHLTVPSHEQRKCNCGKVNCLERFSSASAVERAAGKSCYEVFEDAKAGDEKALSIIDLAVEKLAYAMGNIAVVSDPECFIIGGGMSKAGDFLLEKIRAAYLRNAFHAGRDTDIVLATLGNSAGMYGAFKLLL